jgi:transposase
MRFSRHKGERFKAENVYLKIRSRRGHNIAIVALARKLLIIIHHLLLTGEEYVERTVRRKRLRIIKPSDLKVPFEDALTLLARAGFMISDYD